MGAWKTLRITKPCKLRIDNDNLLIEDDETRIKLCLADVDSIIFEGDRFTLSAKVLAALAKHKVATLFCDERYMPTAILHPYHQSSLATETLKAQLSLPDSFKDTLWAQIVRIKISLQADVLAFLDKSAQKVSRYIDHVRPGDPYKAEAKSARKYWQELFGDLVREPNSFDIRNQALNYAYAICRSLITRDLSAAGFLPALGLWHDNRYNAFNLSDDLMEPFRPIIDVAVYKLLPRFSEEFLLPEYKREIIAIFDTEYVRYREGLSNLRTVSRRYVQDFKKAVLAKDSGKLFFPSIDFEKVDECF